MATRVLAFDLLVQAFLAVGGAQAFAVVGGEGEDREALGGGVLEPVGQSRGGDAILVDQFGESAVGLAGGPRR